MELPVNYNKLHHRQKRAVREAYIKQQDGLCQHCGALLTEGPADEIAKLKVTPKLYPAGFFNNPVHLHHDHNTEMTIGAVHAYCNAVLWEHHGE